MRAPFGITIARAGAMGVQCVGRDLAHPPSNLTRGSVPSDFWGPYPGHQGSDGVPRLMATASIGLEPRARLQVRWAGRQLEGSCMSSG